MKIFEQVGNNIGVMERRPYEISAFSEERLKLSSLFAKVNFDSTPFVLAEDVI